MNPLTGQEIIDMFETIIDDVPEGGIDYELFLMNSVKDEIEGGGDWYFNRGFDNSQIWNPGDNYLSMKDLPADFLSPRTLYLNDDISPYSVISFEKRERYKDTYKRYYIDYKNKQFAICGAGSGARAINLYYAAASPAIELGTSPTWPSTFHPLIPFKMAERWAATSDADDINFRMSREQLRTANDILRQMRQWDARLKTHDYNGKNERRADLSSYPNVVGEEFVN